MGIELDKLYIRLSEKQEQSQRTGLLEPSPLNASQNLSKLNLPEPVGPKETEKPINFQAEQDAYVASKVETIEQQQAKLQRQIELAQNDIHGSEEQLNSLKKTREEAGGIRLSGFYSWASGTLKHLDKQKEAEVQLLGERKERLGELEKTLKQSQTFLKEAQKLEADGQKLEHNQALSLEERVKQAQQKYNEAQEKFVASLQAVSGKGRLITTDEYSEAMKKVVAGYELSIDRLDKTETVLRTTRTTVIVAGATIATGGLTSGTMAVGAGWGVITAGMSTVAATATGIAGGTVLGTIAGGVSNLGEAAGHTVVGNKTGGQALKDAGMQTLGDARTSFFASVGAAVGFGVAGKVAGKVGATLVGRAVSGFVSGGAGAALNSVANAPLQIIQAHREFNLLYADKIKNMSPEEVAKCRQEFLWKRQATLEQVARNAVLDTVVGGLGGAIGSSSGALREGMRSLAARGGVLGAEIGSSFAVGYGGANLRAKLDGREVSFDEFVQEVSGAYVGTVIGEMHHKIEHNKMLRSMSGGGFSGRPGLHLTPLLGDKIGGGALSKSAQGVSGESGTRVVGAVSFGELRGAMMSEEHHRITERQPLSGELTETLRIVPPNSEAGRHFQEKMTEYCQRLYENNAKEMKGSAILSRLGQHDFHANPVQFLMSRSAEPQACYVPNSKPPTIVLSVGLLRKTTLASGKKLPALVTNDHELALIVSHEITHMKVEEWVNDHPISKFDEGIAYVLPLYVLYNNGMNPELSIPHYKKLVRLTESRQVDLREQLLDPHPMPEHIVRLAETTLAGMRQGRGKLSHGKLGQGVKPKAINDTFFAQALGDGQHQSYVATKLPAKPLYDKMPVQDKLGVLGRIIDEMEPRYRVRVDDLRQEIVALSEEVKTHYQHERASPDRGNNVLTDEVHKLADKTLDFAHRHDIELGFNLYSAVSSLISDTQIIRPLGRLHKLNQIQETLVKAVNAKDRAKMIACSQDLLEAVETEPLYGKPQGREFLRALSWHRFEPVAAITAIEQYERTGGDMAEAWISGHEKTVPDPRASSEMSSAGIQPSWRPLTELARESHYALGAALIMGLERDPQVHLALRRHKDIALRYYTGEEQIIPGQPGFNRGLHSISGLQRSLAFCLFDRDGLIHGVAHSPHDLLKPWSVAPEDIVRENLSAFAEEDFIKARTDPAAAARMEKTAAHMHRVGVDELKRLYGFSGEVPKPICLSICENNIALFGKLNASRLTLRARNAAMVVAKFEELLGRANGTEYREPIRQFFFETVNDGIFDGARSTSGYYDKGSFANVEGQFGLDAVKFEITANPFLKFVLNDSHGLFTAKEQFMFLDRIAGDELANALSGIKQMKKSVLSVAEAAGAVALFGPYAERAGITLSKDPSRWYELGEAIGKVETRRFVRAMLECQAISSLNQRIQAGSKPSLSEIRAFIEGVSRAEGRTYTLVDDLLRPVVEEEASSIAAQPEIKSAVSDWKLFADAELLGPVQSEEILAALTHRVKAEPEAKLRMEYGEAILAGGRVQAPKLRQELVEIWAQAIVDQKGLDNQSAPYRQEINEIVRRVGETFSRSEQTTMFAELADRILAQRDLCRDFETKLSDITDKELLSAPLVGTLSEGLISLIRAGDVTRKAALEYLLNPDSPESRQAFLRESTSESGLDEFIEEHGGFDPKSRVYQRYDAGVRHLHEKFWAAPLEVRAAISRELLVPATEGVAVSRDAAFEYAVDKAFMEKGELYDGVKRHAKAYIDALASYRKDLAMAALMVAAERTGRGDVKGLAAVGKALAVCCASMGPAEMKIGQIASVHPDVPKDIRTALARLKWDADKRYRWETVRRIENSRQEITNGYNRYLSDRSGAEGSKPAGGGKVDIVHIGKELGSASIGRCMRLRMSDGQTQVLFLRRPFAHQQAEDGFRTLEGMMSNLGEDDRTLATFGELIGQAKSRLKWETDMTLAPQQYDAAGELYDGLTVRVNGKEISFHSTKATAAGEDFYLMDEVKGEHFSELHPEAKTATEESRALAMAILTVELRNILNGRFDSDRHGGNLKVSGNAVGHYDFKGMSLAKWGQEGYEQVARIIVSAVFEQKFSSNALVESMLREQKAIRERKGRVDPLVAEVQKAILSLGDYTNHLTPTDLRRVFFSALLQGIHPDMRNAIINAVSAELRPHVEGMLEQGTKSPLLLALGVKEDDLVLIRQDKD